ncbi:MAG: energy transducer TonB [Methylovirgula sp.]|nr:energy transducer TonB [Methylovirgula sp.]
MRAMPASFAETILPPQEHGGWRRWGLAAAIVVAVHLALLTAYILTPHDDRPPGAPPDAVMIDLAPVAVAPPPQDEVDTPPQPDQVQPDQPPPPTPNIPPPPDQPPPPVTDTTAPPEPDVLPAEQPEVVMSAPPPPPPKPMVEKQVEKPKPTHHLPKPQRRIKSTRADLPRAARQSAPMAGLNGAAVADWKSEIVMRIMGAKEYPEEARAQGVGGTALVAFSVSSGGSIRGVRLARSSGSAILDRAAVETVRRANPVPPAPAGVNGGAFTVPLHFSVGR